MFECDNTALDWDSANVEYLKSSSDIIFINPIVVLFFWHSKTKLFLLFKLAGSECPMEINILSVNVS